MSRWRWVASLGVIAALAGILIWALLRDAGAGPPLTLAVTTTATTATTSPTSLETTTTVGETTSTTTAEQRLAEVEEILRELRLGWHDAIYRKDEDALWEVVATTVLHDAGVQAMEDLVYIAPPSRELIQVTLVAMLLDRKDCLVVEYESDVRSILGEDALTTQVSVMWPDPRYGWRIASHWKYPNDLWLQDCDNLEREQTP